MNELVKEWKKLVKMITQYDLMYEKGVPLVSDNLYDSLYDRLKEIEGVIGPQKNSPLNKIVSNNLVNKIHHTVPMLSIEHGFGIESLSGFVNRYDADVIWPMVAEHKIDGVSVALRYKSGKFAEGVTRGNGEFGTNVTWQLRFLNIPREVGYLGDLEIRGELYMNNSDFEAVSDRFSSPRNACASILQNKNLTDELKVNFMAHNLVGGESFTTYADMMRFVSDLGFAVAPSAMVANMSDAEQYFNSIDRNVIPYNIDGVVFKINDLGRWSELGNNRKAPKYIFAVKFEPISRETTITEIVFQVGKFGNITPVAVFEPIIIDGNEISRATVHNVEELRNKGYGPGDRVIVSRAGDVVPYLKSKIYDAKNTATVSKCPSCGGELVDTTTGLCCPGSWGCKAQKIQRLQHFCSRNAFNIDGIGPKVLEDLIDLGYIDYPNDLFKIPALIDSGQLDLLKMEKWNTKSVRNLVDSINRARNVKLANFLYAICIPNVGFGHSKTLAEHYKTFEHFADNQKDNTETQIPGIGPVIQNSIREFMRAEEWVFDLYTTVSVS